MRVWNYAFSRQSSMIRCALFGSKFLVLNITNIHMKSLYKYFWDFTWPRERERARNLYEITILPFWGRTYRQGAGGTSFQTLFVASTRPYPRIGWLTLRGLFHQKMYITKLMAAYASICKPAAYSFLYPYSALPYMDLSPAVLLLFRLRRLRLIPVITLYPHTTVLLIDLLCAPFD